jgi:hypothetical protein
MNWSKITHGAWADEIAKGSFDITGTLKFINGRKVAKEKAEQLLKAYWHRVDKMFFGSHTSAHGIGVERWCFIEFGECGKNLHLHFVAKSPCPPELFCCVLNALWTTFNADTAPLHKNWITPIQDHRRTADYVTKDTRHLRSDQAGLMCAHKNPDTFTYSNHGNSGQHTRILNRLSTADLIKAHQAYQIHLALTLAKLGKHQ